MIELDRGGSADSGIDFERTGRGAPEVGRRKGFFRDCLTYLCVLDIVISIQRAACM
jgi:hypothetical protein